MVESVTQLWPVFSVSIMAVSSANCTFLPPNLLAKLHWGTVNKLLMRNCPRPIAFLLLSLRSKFTMCSFQVFSMWYHFFKCKCLGVPHDLNLCCNAAQSFMSAVPPPLGAWRKSPVVGSYQVYHTRHEFCLQDQASDWVSKLLVTPRIAMPLFP